MKILFFASYPTLAIGYSRIANIISNYLAEQGHQVYYFGISNFETISISRYIHPNIELIDALKEEKKIGSSELYGVNTICDFIDKLKPDILFLYNDIIVISRIFNNFITRKLIKNFKIITYLDLVYPYEKIQLVKHIDHFSDIILVLSEYWKTNLVDMNINQDKIKVLQHGFDNEKFYYVDKIEARTYFNLNADDFVILNSNRNNYRKNIDKTIDVFLKFLKIKNMDRKIKLFLNMSLDINNDYNVYNQIEINCIKNKLNYFAIVTSHIFINGSNSIYSDDQLNLLYNSCDIGINTCIGEGFGLCNLEHGGLAKPQIISGVGGLLDIFSNEYSIVINHVEEYYIPNSLDAHGGYAKVCLTDDFVNGLIRYYDDHELVKNHGEKSKQIITEKYNWNNILLNLKNIIV